jgi:hypothetical protein
VIIGCWFGTGSGMTLLGLSVGGSRHPAGHLHPSADPAAPPPPATPAAGFRPAGGATYSCA